ncbi:hypothetical protein [Lonepinella sp. BR2474]|uniref:hypothetical protein n=1 Tax=Lonepinella sp. BR2474 TaxID=3434548 RepID=UPI003F6DAD34
MCHFVKFSAIYINKPSQFIEGIQSISVSCLMDLSAIWGANICFVISDMGDPLLPDCISMLIRQRIIPIILRHKKFDELMPTIEQVNHIFYREESEQQEIMRLFVDVIDKKGVMSIDFNDLLSVITPTLTLNYRSFDGNIDALTTDMIHYFEYISPIKSGLFVVESNETVDFLGVMNIFSLLKICQNDDSDIRISHILNNDLKMIKTHLIYF